MPLTVNVPSPGAPPVQVTWFEPVAPDDALAGLRILDAARRATEESPV